MQFFLDQIRYKDVCQPVILSIRKNTIFVNNKLFPLYSIKSVFMSQNVLFFSVGVPIESEIVFCGEQETIQVVFNTVYGLCCGSSNYLNNIKSTYE